MSKDPATFLEKMMLKLNGLWWFRAFVGLCVGVTPIMVAYAILWLQTNFVTAGTNELAWGNQTDINKGVAGILASQQSRLAVLEASKDFQDESMRQLREDLKEQRRLIEIMRQGRVRDP